MKLIITSFLSWSLADMMITLGGGRVLMYNLKLKLNFYDFSSYSDEGNDAPQQNNSQEFSERRIYIWHISYFCIKLYWYDIFIEFLLLKSNKNIS